MPHEQMNERQVAAYLHMDLREVIKLASRGQIPCRKVSPARQAQVGGQFVFFKGQLDHWVERQMHTLGADRLAKIEKGVGAHHGFDDEMFKKALICPLIPDGAIAVPLKAKTAGAAIRALVDLAESASLVYVRDRLISEIQQREELCTTAMVPGVALPHPRHPMPREIAASFMVIGLTASGIPFGAADGSLTRLFFLICCKDERTHLHVLARLAQILSDRLSVEEMLSAESAEQLRQLLTGQEQAVIDRTWSE